MIIILKCKTTQHNCAGPFCWPLYDNIEWCMVKQLDAVYYSKIAIAQCNFLTVYNDIRQFCVISLYIIIVALN